MQFKTPAVDATTAYIPAWGASVSAVDLRTGAVRWTWQPGRSVGDTSLSGPFRSGAEGVVVSGDTVYANVWHFRDRVGLQSNTTLVAIGARTGKELWRLVFPQYTGGVNVAGAPVVAGSLVVMGGGSGRTWGVDRFSSKVSWQWDPDSATNATVAGPAVLGDVVYVDGGDEHLVALRLNDGSVVWRTLFGGYVDQGLLVTDRYVYAPRGGELFIFDRLTGRIVRKLNQPGRTYDSFIASAPAEQNGRIFVNVKEAAWSFDEP